MRLYTQRVMVLKQMRDAFINQEDAAFKKAAGKQSQLTRQADRLAQTLGLTECVNFLDFGAN